MRNARAAIAAATTMILVGALASLGAAQAATTGVGTSQVSTTVAGVQLGTNGALLGVRLLGDDARSTIDSKVATAAEAFSRFTGVTVSSDTVTALKTLSSTPVESKQPGGEASVTTGSLNLSNPATGVTIPSSVLTGTIGLAHLSSEAAATQAKSALSAALSNATIGGGLASVSGVTSGLNTAALATQSDGSRSVKVDQVVVLDLGSLLAGIGLPLPELSVDTLTALLTTLNTTVNSLDGAAVNALVDDLQDEITALESAVALPGGGTVTDAVTTINDLGNTLGLGTLVDSTTAAALADPALTVTQQLNLLIDELQAALTDVLADVLTTLDGLALLKVDSVDVGVTTKAGDTVANSVATVSGKVGAITVGNAALGTVDVTQALVDVNAKVTEVNDKIKAALNGVDPGLGDMVKVSVFERAGPSIKEADGYVTATDGITGLKASVTPPTTLSTILAAIGNATSAAEAITVAGGAVPNTLSTAMSLLGTTLDNNAAPLGGGATVTLASINSTSNFAPQIAGTGTGTGTGTGNEDDRGSLAATGSNDAVPMTAAALFLIALGLGFREWTRMPAPTAVRTKE